MIFELFSKPVHRRKMSIPAVQVPAAMMLGKTTFYTCFGIIEIRYLGTENSLTILEISSNAIWSVNTVIEMINE